MFSSVKGIQFFRMGSGKLLPFAIHVRDVVLHILMLEGTLCKAKLLHKLAHLIVGEYLLQLFVGQSLGVLASPSSSSLGRVDASITLLSLVRQFLQFQKPLYTLIFVHHIAFKFEL